MTPLKLPELGEIDDVRKRLERLAARLMVFAGQAAKSVWIVCKTNAHAFLVAGDRRFAARTPWPARLFAVKHTIKWHETFPRKTPVVSARSHDTKRHPRPIWSQVVDGLSACCVGALQTTPSGRSVKARFKADGRDAHLIQRAELGASNELVVDVSRLFARGTR